MWSETDYRLAFKDAWNGFAETVEPSLGMSDGIPDLFVYLPPIYPEKSSVARCVPIEFKLVEKRIDPFAFYSSKIRPAQINWHMEWAEAGFFSYFAWGCDKKLYLKAVNQKNMGWLSDYRKGILVHDGLLSIPDACDLVFRVAAHL